MTLLTIATLLPLATDTAGDEANAAALVRRAAQRGLAARAITVARAGDLPAADIYLLGGTGRAGVAGVVAALRATTLAQRVADGAAVVFAVDAGLDVIGRQWVDPAGVRHPGLGMIGAASEPSPRDTRSVVTRPNPPFGLPAMVGWVGADVATVLDPEVRPLALVRPAARGGDDLPDGAVGPGVIATRLHGPVLALNPELADLVLARASGAVGWPPLAVPAVERARQARMAQVLRASEHPGRRWRWRRRAPARAAP